MRHARSLAVPAAAAVLVAAAPALACGGHQEVPFLAPLASTLLPGLFPLSLALLAERVVFAISMRAMGLSRLHRPTVFGPLLFLAGVGVLTMAPFTPGFADAGFASLFLAGPLLFVSFVRSLSREQPGNHRARLLRAGGVALGASLLLASFFGFG